jgi:hypothetical protein
LAIPFSLLGKIIEDGQQEGTFKAGDPKHLAIVYWACFQGMCIYKLTMKSFVLPQPELLDGILLKNNG